MGQMTEVTVITVPALSRTYLPERPRGLRPDFDNTPRFIRLWPEATLILMTLA